MVVRIFENDDQGYRSWLTDHQDGFVLNLRMKRRDPNYTVLHQSRCPMISAEKHFNGGYTSRNYRKACATDVVELRQIARDEGRIDGSFSTECPICLK